MVWNKYTSYCLPQTLGRAACSYLYLTLSPKDTGNDGFQGQLSSIPEPKTHLVRATQNITLVKPAFMAMGISQAGRGRTGKEPSDAPTLLVCS